MDLAALVASLIAVMTVGVLVWRIRTLRVELRTVEHALTRAETSISASLTANEEQLDTNHSLGLRIEKLSGDFGVLIQRVRDVEASRTQLARARAETEKRCAALEVRFNGLAETLNEQQAEQVRQLESLRSRFDAEHPEVDRSRMPIGSKPEVSLSSQIDSIVPD